MGRIFWFFANTVSILVLMDVGLKRQGGRYFRKSHGVSILVLMDVGLKPNNCLTNFCSNFVSILVLMDVGLKQPHIDMLFGR